MKSNINSFMDMLKRTQAEHVPHLRSMLRGDMQTLFQGCSWKMEMSLSLQEGGLVRRHSGKQQPLQSVGISFQVTLVTDFCLLWATNTHSAVVLSFSLLLNLMQPDKQSKMPLLENMLSGSSSDIKISGRAQYRTQHNSKQSMHK